METVSGMQKEIVDYAQKRLREGVASISVQNELQSRRSNVIADAQVAATYIQFAQQKIASAKAGMPIRGNAVATKEEPGVQHLVITCCGEQFLISAYVGLKEAEQRLREKLESDHANKKPHGDWIQL